ncbi:MAG TPA: hypothetical protein VL137_07980 [Polyangiaceae bacterium]|jgi:hypothetical protein|nr:hypothetical protein [Polyangiaceae bacterium]
MKTTFLILTIVSGAALTLGCQFYARSPEDYKKVTRELLETRRADIKECFDKESKASDKAHGTVVVHFTVEAKTGKILKAEALPESTAPKALGDCVVAAMDGLALNPPDNRTGDATFTYEFTQK